MDACINDFRSVGGSLLYGRSLSQHHRKLLFSVIRLPYFIWALSLCKLDKNEKEGLISRLPLDKVL
jgi:hypothetical protein